MTGQEPGNYKWAITTRPLDGVSHWDALQKLILFVSERFQEANVSISLGWGTRLPIEELWEPQPFTTEEIVPFLRAQILLGIVEIGSSDIFILFNGTGLTIQSCHEKDIHVEGQGAALAEIIREYLRNEHLVAEPRSPVVPGGV